MFFRFFKKRANRSSVKHSFQIISTLKSNYSIGKLSFTGDYKYGSKGNVDADFIYDKVVKILSDNSVQGLLVDFTGLNYTWGNRILESQSILYAANIPCAVVYSDNSKAMVADFDDFYYTSEDKAVTFITQALAKSEGSC